MENHELQQAVQYLNSQDLKTVQYIRAMSIINTDGETVAPRESYRSRGDVMEQLAGLLYDLFADERGYEAAKTVLASTQVTEEERRLAEMRRDSYEEMTRLPKEEVMAYQKLLSDAAVVWREAKRNNDFPRFAPYLEKIVDTCRRFALLKHPEKDPYDTLLDEYEKGMTQSVLDPFFALLREKLTPLVRAVAACPKPDDTFLKGKTFPLEGQKKLSAWLMEVMGINKDRCVLLESEHPFTSGSSIWDTRITTHYYETDVMSSVYSVIHEGGHALYELGISESLANSTLGNTPFLGIHESQSRFYENILGRSEEFVSLLHGKMKELFPQQMAEVTPEMMYRAVNRVEPGLIRIEADELTYAMHIMVRYELEKELIGGTLKVADLPRRWNEMYREYLGVEVPGDDRGVLQDIHWSGGSIGYFPTYALGSAYGAQMRCAMEGQVDVKEALRQGDLSPVTAWLRERIHQYGALRLPERLLRDAVGAPFDPAYFVDYLTKKFSAIYGL